MVEEAKDVKKLTAKELYAAIEAYPEDTWVGSPEYYELMRRLRAMDVDELRAKGYSIPNWKLGIPADIKAPKKKKGKQ